MASLAGLIRAGAESGEVSLPAGLAVQTLLTDLEARLAEVAVRPGRTGVTTAVAPAGVALLTPLTTPFEHFLAEQAAYADLHIDDAHRTVADIGTLASEHVAAKRMRLRGIRVG
jgi:hypothetical protein